MCDGWRHVALGDLLTIDIEPVVIDPLATYQLAGVYSFGRGLFEREQLLGAKTKYKFVHRLRQGRLVMSKLKAWEGALAVVPEAFDGFVLSPEFPTFRTHDDLDSQFLGLLCTQPSFWQMLQRQSQGMGGRRERVHPRRLLEIQVLLPPLNEQKRIVDLVAAVDQCAEAVSRQRAAISNAIQSFREAVLIELAAEPIILGDILLGIEAGKSPAAMDRLPGPDERAVLKVSAIRLGQFDPNEVKTVDPYTPLPEASRVNAGDVLMTRANTRQLVGAVCRVMDVPDGYFLCDKTLRLIPDETRISADFLVEVLQSAQVREQIELAATGTSASMKNVSQASIRSLRIPLPPMEKQVNLVSILIRLRAVGVALAAENQALSNARAEMLGSLLSGAHLIPDSYDELLEAAG